MHKEFGLSELVLITPPGHIGLSGPIWPGGVMRTITPPRSMLGLTELEIFTCPTIHGASCDLSTLSGGGVGAKSFSSHLWARLKMVTHMRIGQK